MNRREALSALLVAGTLAFEGCDYIFPVRYRFRLIAEVSTPDGVRSGSSVLQISTRRQPRIGDASGFHFSIRGDAVAIDLPTGALFILPDWWLTRAVNSAFMPYDRAKTMKDYDLMTELSKLSSSRSIGQSVDLSPASTSWKDNQYRFARFRDIRDPSSAEWVDPTDLAASFGPGVALRHVIAQLTGDHPSSGIEQRFPWWRELKAKRARLNGQTGPIGTNSASDNLDTGSFKAEDY